MTITFVAEVSSNHNRDIDRCFRLIETAARIGCSAVKFQLFRVDRLFAASILERSEEHRRRKEWELPVEFLPLLRQRCLELDLLFACTPFYLEAVEELASHVHFYKIASYELLWKDLLAACAQSGKPVVLSTGMATIEEIEGAVDILLKEGCRDLTLLHCVSAYPTPAGQCNLAVIETLRRRFGCRVGWSDHSVSPAVIYRAVHRWQASLIEFHLDLDGRGEEYHLGHCWLPDRAEEMITTVQEGICSDGSPLKQIMPAEKEDRGWRRDPGDGLRPLRQKRIC